MDLYDPSLDGFTAIYLLDDGAGPDTTAGDGVYSANHSFAIAGSFPFQAKADIDGHTLYLNGGVAVLEEALGTRHFPPWTPLNVTASTGPGAGNLSIAWDENPQGDAATEYRIYRGTTPASLAHVATITRSGTSFKDTGLPDNSTFQYHVEAWNDVGYSAPSSLVANTTISVVPTSPLDLSAVAGPEEGQVFLDWTEPVHDGGDAIDAYAISRGTDNESFTHLGSIAATQTNYTDAGATPGTRYYYHVAATNIAGEGPESKAASARPYTELLTLPGIPILPVDTPEVHVATVEVCDAQTDVGCEVGGDEFLCIDLHMADEPPVNLACVEHELVPPAIHEELHGLSPTEVIVPSTTNGLLGSTMEIQVLYEHEANLLYSVSILPPVPMVCAPVEPTEEDVDWLLSNGSETELILVIHSEGSIIQGWPGPEAFHVPYVGQVVSASRATLEAGTC